MYIGKFYMKCFNFCKQYEDYFATARVKVAKQIFFATSFFCYQISFCWQKCKWKQNADSFIPVT